MRTDRMVDMIRLSMKERLQRNLVRFFDVFRTHAIWWTKPNQLFFIWQKGK